jgi:large subunit ribosomal protein L21
MAFAIVRAGGRQEKVEVGTILTVDRLKAATADTVSFGPKIVIQNYKNKTGYKRRMGFRADLTRVKITSITTS